MPPPRPEAETINAYGDRLIETSGKHGADIASQRFDELDTAALDHVAALGSKAVCADLGCGAGAVGLQFARLGARVALYDLIPPSPQISEAQREGCSITYHQSDLRLIGAEDLPERLNVVLSQRTIHYLAVADARRLVSAVRARMYAEGRFYLSASGLHSELGKGYPAARAQIADRFSPLATGMATKHGILEAVCLYTPEDLVLLMEEAGYRTLKVWASPFGNIKGVFGA